MKTRIIFATVVAGVAATLCAQDGPVTVAQGGFGFAVSGEPANYKFVTRAFSFSTKTVTNAPYSADEKTESVQTLGDGTKIANTTTAKVYRDSQGRTRREITTPENHTLVTIFDPVGGKSVTLDPQTKTAHEMPGGMMYKVAAEKMAADRAVSDKPVTAMRLAPRIEGEIPLPPELSMMTRSGTPKHEDLGIDVVEGVSAAHTRDTTVIETGAVGNDRPITITSERWMSPELKIEVKSIYNDPRMGQTTHALTNVSRAEPDPSLFQVPPDYRLEEPKGAIRFEHYEDHKKE